MLMLFGGAQKICAQPTDTLQPVVLFATEDKKFTTGNVIQSMGRDALVAVNSKSVADAARYFSGVLVKDYGGLGGLKTVSVRGLGAHHTGVMYDGIVMADARAGMVDLGRFSTSGLQGIRMYSGGAANELLPARSFSTAGVLALIPQTHSGKKNDISGNVEGGSFGLLGANLNFSTPLDKRSSIHLSTQYLRSDGGYPYPSYENESTLKRKNAHIDQARLEMNVPVVFRDSSALQARVYTFISKRGLPGAVILYNEGSPQNLNNAMAAVQLTYRKKWNRNTFMAAGKSMYDRQQYIDPHYLNSAGYLENDFHQQEYYLSLGYAYQFNSNTTATVSSDVFKNMLRRKDDFDDGFRNPDRLTSMTHVAINHTRKKWNFSAGLLHTSFHQKVSFGNAGNNVDGLTPSLHLSVQPILRLPVRFRSFYKSTLRAPSLDEQFYTYVGNADLQPEKTHQLNAGIVYHQAIIKGVVQLIQFSVDGYYSKVTDKIIAIPRNNLFQWSMMNVGKAEAQGMDLALQLDLRAVGKIKTQLAGTYTRLISRDKTRIGSVTYNQQLPYVPVHSGSVRSTFQSGNLKWSWNMLFSSQRYRSGEQIAANRLQGYALHDLNIRYAFAPKEKQKFLWEFQFSANNIFNQRYEFIQFFPMPGFHWQAGINFYTQ